MESGAASRHDALREERIALEAEVERLIREICEKKELLKQHGLRIQELNQQELNRRLRVNALDDNRVTIRNYFDRFEWSDILMEQLKGVFGIDKFRLAQEGCVLLCCLAAPSQVVERHSCEQCL
jgi:hypothetical protein